VTLADNPLGGRVAHIAKVRLLTSCTSKQKSAKTLVNKQPGKVGGGSTPTSLVSGSEKDVTFVTMRGD
jgi:hypothetical protein